MKAAVQNFIARLLVDAAENIKSGKFALDDEEMMSLASFFSHRKMYIEQVTQYLHLSPRSVDRKIELKELPEWHKEPSGKKYMWQDEIERKLLENRRNL